MPDAPDNVRECQFQIAELVRQAINADPTYREKILAAAAVSVVRAADPSCAVFAYFGPKDIVTKILSCSTVAKEFKVVGPPPAYPVVRCVFIRGQHVLWGDIDLYKNKWVTGK